MFDIATRKQVFGNMVSALSKLPCSPTLIGAIIFFCHNIGIGVPIVITLIGQIDVWFYLSYALLAFLIPLHIYFRGCICIRLERHFLGLRDWKGMWVVPFGFLDSVGLPLTKNTESNIYLVTGITVMLLGLLRMAWSQFV
jgi:hypothetical protein